ncbi:MAG: hypothetical protein NC906_04170 [Candidatus Omnitrophica bacterium]|nr:hypothetical protein [Candidatus Omnitrophota bacterium]
MEQKFIQLFLIACIVLLQISISYAREIVIVEKGKSDAKILVSSQAGNFEKLAASDLAKYIEKMTGVRIEIINSEPQITDLLARKDIPIFIIGTLALKENPQLQKRLDTVKKKKPVLRADAIAIKT